MRIGLSLLSFRKLNFKESIAYSLYGSYSILFSMKNKKNIFGFHGIVFMSIFDKFAKFFIKISPLALKILKPKL